MISSIFILSGLLLGVLLLSNKNRGIRVLMVLAIMVSGSVEYWFPSLHTFSWAVAVTGIVFLLCSFANNNYKAGFVYSACLGALLVCSALTGIVDINEFITASKGLYQFMFLVLLVPSYSLSRNEVLGLTKLMVSFGMWQIPLALLQRFVFVDFHSRSAPGDSIVGSFGGSLTGGGTSGAMASFLVIVMLYYFVRYIHGKISLGKLCTSCLLLIIPILFCEAKVVFVLLPISVGVIVLLAFFNDSSVRSLIVFVLGALLAALILIYYFNYMQHVNRFDKNKSIQEYVDKRFNKQFGNSPNLKYTRMSSLSFWYAENEHKVDRLLLGYGLGATKHSGLTVGALYNFHRYKSKDLSITLITSLLWDIGLLGTLFYCSIYVYSLFLTVHRYRKYKNDENRWFYLFCTSSMITILLNFFYHTYPVTSQAFAFVTILILSLSLTNISTRDDAVT